MLFSAVQKSDPVSRFRCRGGVVHEALAFLTASSVYRANPAVYTPRTSLLSRAREPGRRYIICPPR